MIKSFYEHLSIDDDIDFAIFKSLDEVFIIIVSTIHSDSIYPSIL